MRLPLLLLIGAALGLIGAVIGFAGTGGMSDLAHYGAVYILVVVLLGVGAPSARVAATRSLVCFVSFVAVYYGTIAIRFHAVPLGYASAWLAAAVLGCPAAAAVVSWSRRRHAPYSAVVAAVAAAAAVSDGAIARALLALGGREGPDVVRPLLAGVDLLVAVVIVAVVPRSNVGRLLAGVLGALLAPVGTLLGFAAHYGPGPYG